jgi:hypothetical protein
MAIKKNAPKKAAAKVNEPRSTTAATKQSTSPLRKLAASLGPRSPQLVALVLQGTSRVALNELGASYTSQSILAEVEPFARTQLGAWKKLGAKDRGHFIGWSEALVAEIVHEAVKLADLLEAFERSSSSERGAKKSTEARYKTLRNRAIAQRDQAVRVVRPLLAKGSDAAQKLGDSSLRSETPAELAAGIAAVAQAAKGLIATSSPEAREALAGLLIDDALVGRLEALATEVKDAGEALTKGAPEARVAQEQLDEQDGVVLRMIQLAWRAWREGRRSVPSVPLPDLGELRGIVKTGTRGDGETEPTPTPTE